MNKKKILNIAILLFAISISLFALNPIVGGENIYQIASPDTLSNGNSVTGGALPYSTAVNIATNPALTATEQRVVVDIAFTSLMEIPTEKFGFAGHVGAVIPSKYGVFTGSVYAVSSRLENLDLGTNISLWGGFAKDITEKLSVGASVNVAFGSATAANLGLGFTYQLGKINWLPFLQDVKWGFAFSGIGYGYKPETTGALYDGKTSSSPSDFTPRIGISGTFINTEKFDAGLALDLSAPFFQNLIVYPEVQVLFLDMIRLKVGTEVNLRELLAGKASVIPGVSLSVKFGINTKDDSFLAKQGWQQSELVPASGYRFLNGNIQAASVGITAHLGLRDTESPEINLW